MKPIRGEQEQEFAHDPWDHKQNPLGQNNTTHVVGDEGGIESYRSAHRHACTCGCLKPAGGFCAQCMLPSCVDCHGFCGKCHMPICPKHSVFNEDGNGKALRLCKPCHGSSSRKQLVRGIVRGLLSPFFRFGDDDGQR